MQRLNPIVRTDTQRFLDEPVYVTISEPKPLALLLHAMYRRPWVIHVKAKPVPRFISSMYRGAMALPRVTVEISPSPPPARIEEFSHYDRVPLRWMKPDGQGGLVPKYEGSRA